MIIGSDVTVLDIRLKSSRSPETPALWINKRSSAIVRLVSPANDGGVAGACISFSGSNNCYLHIDKQNV